MNASIQTKIPTAELEVFRYLKDIWVVVDVGARTDTDYLEIKPHITCHLFEPHPDFFVVLKDKVGANHNVHLNNYGLGDEDGVFAYNEGIQAMTGGEAWGGTSELKFPVKTLDGYVKEKNITRVDFLKIDCEGYDYKVLLGGKEALVNTRYLQYEHWSDKEQYHPLLEKDFEMHYIGYRNVLCINRTLVSEADRIELVRFLEEGKFSELA